MIKVWAFDRNTIQGRESPDYYDPRVLQAAFNANLERLASLEELGFEGVFFGEHHFVDLLCPNPNLLIAALAKMSKILKLGVMGNVLVFHQPWRLIEDLGMLDYLTEGRLEIGIAAGVPQEFAIIGVPPEEVRPRYEEMLDFLDGAWDQKIVRHQGRFWDYAGVPVTPIMRPETRRRKWMTVFSAESAAVGARRGYKLCTGFQSTQKATHVFQVYRDAARTAGWTAGPDDLGLRRQVLICETDTEAQSLNKELIETAQLRMAASAARLQSRTSGNAGDTLSDDILKSGMMDAASPGSVDMSKLKHGTFMPPGLLSMEDEFICGSPASVTEQIVGQCRQAGAGNFLSYSANGLDQHELDVQFRLWERVIPALNKASIDKATE